MDNIEKLAKLKEKWLKGMGIGIAFPQEMYDFVDGKTDFPKDLEDYVVGRCYGYREKLPKFLIAELKGDLRQEACRMMHVCALSRRNAGLVQSADDISTFRLADLPFEELFDSLAAKNDRLDARTLSLAKELGRNYAEQSRKTVDNANIDSMKPTDKGYAFTIALGLAFWTENPEQEKALGETLTAQAMKDDNADCAMAIALAGSDTSKKLGGRLKSLLQADANLAFRLYDNLLQRDNDLFAATIEKVGAPRWLPYFAQLYDFATAFVLNASAAPDALTALDNLWDTDKDLFRETYDNLLTTANGSYQWLALFLFGLMLRHGEGNDKVPEARHIAANIAARLFDESAALADSIEKKELPEKTWAEEMTKMKTWPPEARRSRFIFAPPCVAALLGLDETGDYIVGGWLTHKKHKPLNDAQRQIALCALRIQHLLHKKEWNDAYDLLTRKVADTDFTDIFHILLTADKQTQSLLDKQLLTDHSAEARELLKRDIGPKNIVAWLDILFENGLLTDAKAVEELTQNKNKNVKAKAEEIADKIEA